MKLCLAPLSSWLATILLMAMGMLAPSLAVAHPGHGEERGQSRLVAFQPSTSTASLDRHEDLANALLRGDESPAVNPAILEAQPDEAHGCAGAVCCGTGHACCAVYLPGGNEPPPLLAGNPLALFVTGAPPGLGAPRLPEPPRPSR